MPLMTCADCQSEVSDTLSACPKCGRRFAAEAKAEAVRARKRTTWIQSGAIAAVGVLVVICQPSEEPTGPGSTGGATSSTTLAAGTAAPASAVGQCYLNRTNGKLVGRIDSIGRYPRTRERVYVIANEAVPDRPWYMPIEGGRVVDCAQARAEIVGGEALVGQCAHNPSDGAFLGRIAAVGALGRDAYGDAAPGQRPVTVKLTRERRQRTGVDTIVVTYPSFLVVLPCGAK